VRGVQTTNIDCGGHRYLAIYNTYATQLSTNTLYYTTKISAP
jgi:hypothetical protein